MQTLFSIEELQSRYADRTNQIFSSSNSDDPSADFNIQMAKLGWGLLSGFYSLKPIVETEPLVSNSYIITTRAGYNTHACKQASAQAPTHAHPNTFALSHSHTHMRARPRTRPRTHAHMVSD